MKFYYQYSTISVFIINEQSALLSNNPLTLPFKALRLNFLIYLYNFIIKRQMPSSKHLQHFNELHIILNVETVQEKMYSINLRVVLQKYIHILKAKPRKLYTQFN